jgi:23S rRNA pseudouridine1911/1915/1917 synthase
MASLSRGGRHAITDYELLEALPGSSMLELTLQTGRTHQIRVHCSEAGCPILGDEVYGGHWRRGLPSEPLLTEALEASGRQLLHARELGFVHPADGRTLHFIAEPPEDFLRVLRVLRDIGAPMAER